MTFFQGTFDILNACHTECLKKFKHLVIGLNTDNLVRSYKKREPIFPYKERKIILLGIKNVDKVIPCNEFSCLKQLKKLRPKIFVLGKEWINTHQKEIEFVKSYGGKVVYTKNYKYQHSSEIRKKIIKYG